MTMRAFLLAAAMGLAALSFAQCDPMSVDFGEESWGLAPDGETTFFDTAYVDVAYMDEVHLLVPSFAIDVVPDFPLNAPIDSVVIEGVFLVDTVSGDTLTFAEAGLDYTCNNNGDCVNPCTFLGGEQYCASFSGTPIVEGDYVLGMEVAVWGTVFGFPLSYPTSFDGFPFLILGDTTNGVAEEQGQVLAYPNPVRDRVTVEGALGAQAVLRALDGRLVRQFDVRSNIEVVSLSAVPNGIYFLGLQRQGEEEVIRLSVQH
ncbi:MAG: T9SS C-terminal target domain-containing protein [Crocinitomicaceae bacterium TMED114]|nr:MAG: T9SS C-terminal target domain-containing protein [Crocinitomicaceae bacterium TMED114]|tara:strand:- start:305 stop:1081 length:777 start_codon:yes stop_codon:yes gene_type:complete